MSETQTSPSAPEATPEPTPSSSKSPEPSEAQSRPSWRERATAWIRRALTRLAWGIFLVLLGMAIAYSLWVRPLQAEKAKLQQRCQEVQTQLAQAQAELGQARGRITQMRAELDAAQQQAFIAQQWATYAQARAEVLAAHLALADGQKTAARTHLTLAQRALQRLARQAVDPALRVAARELAATLEGVIQKLDTASARTSVRRLSEEVLPALDALEDLLPPRP